MGRNDRNLVLEDVQIAFRNFAGKEGPYNKAGDRNFAILLDDELAEQMLRDGWNVKHLKPREDDEAPQAYISVAISYKNRPPKIALITSKAITYLEEDQLDLLDWVDIKEADVTLNPYEWVVNGKTGTKAYAAGLFIEILEDYLQTKWTNRVEENRRLALAAGGNDYIDAEVLPEPLQIG